jgi:hypothetical protein
MERRAKLLGLDAPQRHRVHATVAATMPGIDPDEIARMEEAWVRATPARSDATMIVEADAVELPAAADE